MHQGGYDFEDRTGQEHVLIEIGLLGPTTDGTVMTECEVAYLCPSKLHGHGAINMVTSL